MTPEEFYNILRSVPDAKPVEFRLYHDDQGCPLFYSMEDLPGSWISVDAVTYAQARHDIRVVGDSFVELPKQRAVRKLRPSQHGQPCDPRDICMIVSDTQPHVKWELSNVQD